MPLTRMTLEERIQCVRLYSKHNEKPSSVQIAWRKEYRTDPPSCKTIVTLNKKFNMTGAVADLSRSGRPKTSNTPTTISHLEDIIKRCPTKSIRSIAQDLGIAKASVHRMKKDIEKNQSTASLSIENKRLKETVVDLSRKMILLEKKLSEKQRISSTNSDANVDLNSNALFKISDSSTIFTLTPIPSENGQIIHFPQTLQLIEVHNSDQVTSSIDSNLVGNISSGTLSNQNEYNGLNSQDFEWCVNSLPS